MLGVSGSDASDPIMNSPTGISLNLIRPVTVVMNSGSPPAKGLCVHRARAG